jgi:outer membrane lipoprotein carrier protein
MFFILASFLALVQAAAGQRQDLPTLVQGVDRTFSRMSDLTADFVQIIQDPLNQKKQASGHLYLKRPRMMRWDYENPEKQQFVTDGKMVYFYVPADRQVTKDQVRDVVDERMPLMFLVGQSNLQGEFTRFERLSTKPFLEGTAVIRMFPKRKTDLKEIVMEVDPLNYQIRRLLLTGEDDSRSEFIFSNIRTNTGLEKSLFDFKIPPGVEVLSGIGQ